jgi:hypothetical protein
MGQLDSQLVQPHRARGALLQAHAVQLLFATKHSLDVAVHVAFEKAQTLNPPLRVPCSLSSLALTRRDKRVNQLFTS